MAKKMTQDEIQEIVMNIDNLQDMIQNHSKEIQEQIIDFAYTNFMTCDFIDFVSYEFTGDELSKILKKYNLN